MSLLGGVSSLVPAGAGLVGKFAPSISNVLLATPKQIVGYQPQNPSGSSQTDNQLPSLVFHYEGEQTALLESDITDHYIEDNTAIEDQIALKPEIITTHGFIGELNNTPPPGFGLLSSFAESLPFVSAFAPGFSQSALNAINTAQSGFQAVANAEKSLTSAWSSITGENQQTAIGAEGIVEEGANQNKQQIMFQQFYGYWRNRTLFTVQTPWAVFTNMAIKSLRAIQDAETRVVTDFEVTFKMIRTASTSVSSDPSASFQGRSLDQALPVANLGTQTPPSSISLSSGLSQMGVA